MPLFGSQNLVPLVNIKIAGKWMFIPLKMVLIGIDPYPFHLWPKCTDPLPLPQRRRDLQSSAAPLQRAPLSERTRRPWLRPPAAPAIRDRSTGGGPGMSRNKWNKWTWSAMWFNFFLFFFPETEDQYWERRGHSLIEKQDEGWKSKTTRHFEVGKIKIA